MICSNEVYGKSVKLQCGAITQENIPNCMLIAQGESCYNNYQIDPQYKSCLVRYGISEKKILNEVPR